MPNTYACKLVSNPNVPIFLPRVCTLVLFIYIVPGQRSRTDKGSFTYLPLSSKVRDRVSRQIHLAQVQAIHLIP